MKKRIKEIILFLILAILVSSKIFTKYIGDLDEIWNYNFANCISKGLVPYRDFNIVQTPLLAIISGAILSLTVNELLVMRVLAVILCTSIFFTLYKINESLEININFNLLFLLFIFYITKDNLCIDYNYFSLLLTLIIIYLELNQKKDNFKSNFIIGILRRISCFK